MVSAEVEVLLVLNSAKETNKRLRSSSYTNEFYLIIIIFFIIVFTEKFSKYFAVQKETVTMVNYFK